MVPPISQFLNICDSGVRELPGAKTITSTERVNIWHIKILKKFKKVVNTTEEDVLFNVMEDYHRLLNDQIIHLKDRHLLKDKISEHLYCLHLFLRRFQEEEIVTTRSFLNSMGKLLCLFIDLQLEIISLTKDPGVSFVTQELINGLHIYMRDNLTSILHVLLKLSDKYVDKSYYQDVMDLIYKHFLVTTPILDTSDLNFALHYLIYEKWKKTKHVQKHSGMDKFLLYTFNKTPNYIRNSKLMRNILKPSFNEITHTIDGFVNGVEARIIKYFKYFEQHHKPEKKSIENNGTFKRRINDPYEIEFVSSMLYIKTFQNKTGGPNSVENMPHEDDVVIIDDEEDSDVEMVPLDEDEDIIGTLPNKNTLPNENTLSNENTSSVENILPIEEATSNPSELVTLFDSISIVEIREDIKQLDDAALMEWTLTHREKTNKSFKTIKILHNFLERISVTEVCDEHENNEKANDKEYSPRQTDEVMKPIMVETATTMDEDHLESNSEMNTDHVIHNHHEHSHEQPSSKNVSMKSLQINSKEDHNEVQTNGNADVCTYCVCQHGAMMPAENILLSTKIDELVSQPSHKDVEIQTDNDVPIANVYNFRAGVDTPPSDLDNCVSPPNSSYLFLNPLTNYVKNDSYHEIYTEINCATLRFGDSATQANLEQPEVNQDVIKIHDETFEEDFHYSASASSSLSESNFDVEIPTNVTDESQLLIKDSIANPDEDGLKMPHLEPETDDTYAESSPNLSGPSTRVAMDLPKNNQDTVPSPPFEAINSDEFRDQLSEVKNKKKSGILKNSSSDAGGSSNNVNNSLQPSSSNSLVLRGPVSTRATSKRKNNSNDEETLPKNRKVNFADNDIVVHIPKENPRRITFSIVEQAKDSMCICNVHKQDNKLIYLEPSIPIDIMPYSQFLEEHKLRQINTFNKNINNIFFNKPISLKGEPAKTTLHRIDYNKFQKSSAASSSASSSYTTISLCSANSPGFTRMRKPPEQKGEVLGPNLKCESSQHEEILVKQPRVLLTRQSANVLQSQQCQENIYL